MEIDKEQRTLIKSIGLFIALWIVSYFVVDAFSYSRDSELVFMQSLALATLIAFVWKRIAKKYL